MGLETHTSTAHSRRESCSPCSQCSCNDNLQALAVTGDQHSDVETPGDRVVYVLLASSQQHAIQNLHDSTRNIKSADPSVR